MCLIIPIIWGFPQPQFGDYGDEVVNETEDENLNNGDPIGDIFKDIIDGFGLLMQDGINLITNVTQNNVRYYHYLTNWEGAGISNSLTLGQKLPTQNYFKFFLIPNLKIREKLISFFLKYFTIQQGDIGDAVEGAAKVGLGAASEAARIGLSVASTAPNILAQKVEFAQGLGKTLGDTSGLVKSVCIS